MKIVAPLVCRLPAGARYRVILIERDYDEILDSQAKMIERRGESIPDSPKRRERLRREYARLIEQTRRVLSSRPGIQVLSARYESIAGDPREAVEQINRSAGGGLNAEAMVAAVVPSLYRNRRASGASA